VNEDYINCPIVYEDEDADPAVARTYSSITTNPDWTTFGTPASPAYDLLDEFMVTTSSALNFDRYFDITSTTGIKASIQADHTTANYCDAGGADKCNGMDSFNNFVVTITFTAKLRDRPSESASDTVVITLKDSCEDY
jgi:hypothetical protein